MCGIAGIFSLNRHPLTHADEEAVQKMIARLTHRGPDGYGVLRKGPICLGHRRLAIIDLEGGAQPMESSDALTSIVFNGEIYNFGDLRLELESLGVRFRTNSDTEVILEAYQNYGLNAVKKLEGMFAYALFDRRNYTLTLARDRFGKKPLFYTIQQGKCFFASEITSLLCLKELSFHLDPEAIPRFLAYEYVPEPQTIFKEISSLLPAHTLTLGSGTVLQRRYWDLPYPTDTCQDINDICQNLRDHLKLAVKRRMISDVPLGVFLSGGLDSSIVTALMAQESVQPVKTFAIGFREASYDESGYAQIVAKAYATDHHEEILDASVCADLLPEIVRKMDVPMADASVAPTYLLSKITRQSVTVALGGDGSDELFAGYENYAAYQIALFYQKFPTIIKKIIEKISAHLPKSQGYVNLNLAMETFLNGAKAADWLRIERLLCAFYSDRLQSILAPAFKETLTPHSLEDDALFASTKLEYNHWPKGAASPLARAFHVYARQFLPQDILVKVDRCSMLNSLEVRAPFLDTNVAEFTAKLPLSFKMAGLKGKWILRKAMADILPKAILHRNKRGFQIPVAAWLRTKMRPLVLELLEPKRLKEQGIFQIDAIERLKSEHLEGYADHRKPLWALLVLQLWLESHQIAI